jgi:hypothetical protein
MVLLWMKRDERPRLLLKNRPGTKVPHFMVKSDTGVHHYRTERDLLPWPLCYAVFEGRFQTVQTEEEYEKR